MARNARAERADDEGSGNAALLQETEAVKRLLMLLLVKIGSTSEEIGAVLGVDPSVVRRVVPSRKVKKLVLGNSQEGD